MEIVLSPPNNVPVSSVDGAASPSPQAIAVLKAGFHETTMKMIADHDATKNEKALLQLDFDEQKFILEGLEFNFWF